MERRIGLSQAWLSTFRLFMVLALDTNICFLKTRAFFLVKKGLAPGLGGKKDSNWCAGVALSGSLISVLGGPSVLRWFRQGWGKPIHGISRDLEHF